MMEVEMQKQKIWGEVSQLGFDNEWDLKSERKEVVKDNA